ncbi:MAG TPA: glycoside hydrolase family 2, partial [Bacteroidales bacterium]|nr:glycoside hydrolase family 2 [Bacteroidales bacterium]
MYGGNAFAHKCEDIIGPRYPQIHDLITNVYLVPEKDDPRPSFLDEYLAVTGNGGGGLDDYWDAFYRYPRSMGGAIWDFVSTGITEKIRTLKDGSANNIQVNAMGRAKLVPGVTGKGIDLNGHDQWVEVYRDNALEISGDNLTLTLMVFPRALSSSAGTLITKGNYQFGIRQIRKDSLEFYLTTRSRQKVQIALPGNWENNWHFVTAK